MAGRSQSEQPAGLRAADLRVYLLARPCVDCAGHPLLQRRPRALLTRLTTRPQPGPHEHLYHPFWPDTLALTARRNFSRLLTNTLRALPVPNALLTKEVPHP